MEGSFEDLSRESGNGSTQTAFMKDLRRNLPQC